MTVAQHYDWSRLVAKVKLPAPLLQAIVDLEETCNYSDYIVAKWHRFNHDTETTMGHD